MKLVLLTSYRDVNKVVHVKATCLVALTALSERRGDILYVDI